MLVFFFHIYFILPKNSLNKRFEGVFLSPLIPLNLSPSTGYYDQSRISKITTTSAAQHNASNINPESMIETKRNTSHAAVHVELENCVLGVCVWGRGETQQALHTTSKSTESTRWKTWLDTLTHTQDSLASKKKKKYHMEYVVCTYLVYLIRIRNEMGRKKTYFRKPKQQYTARNYYNAYGVLRA